MQRLSSRPRARSTSTALTSLLVALLTAGAAGLAGAPPASAHARLRSTSPAAGARVTAAPQEVVLTFTEPPVVLGSLVRVTGPDGQIASVGGVRVVDDQVRQTLSSGLADGTYRVDWKVTSDDGHPVSDRFTFTVAAGTPSAPATSRTSTSVPATVPTTGATSTTTTTPAAVVADSATPASQTRGGSVAPWLLLAVALLLAAAALPVTRSIRRARQSGARS